MEHSFHSDQFGRLIAVLRDENAQATATASDAAAGAADLAHAIREAAASGFGECYWPESAGEYRWVLRNNDGRVRVVILWSAGTLTGWEHVFWSECPLEDLTGSLLETLERAGTVAAAG